MYPLNENETGLFQELARKNDVIFGQLSYLVINPKCYRGGHYHKRKEEWFCCLHGSCELTLTDINQKTKRTTVLEKM